MDISAPAPARRLIWLALAIALTALLLTGPAATVSLAAPEAADEHSVVLAAEERDRRPIAATPRSQFALMLYGLMGLGVVAGIATMRRQLKGDRPQSDGEFRWR
jgi:hypothetical protein